MTSTSLFPAAEEDARQAILRAAYDALCEYGYADLSTQRIADASPKSKSLIYHHYDDKDDLLLDLLDHLLERFQTETRVDADNPREHVEEVLDGVLAAELPPERRAFTKAMVSLRSRAAYDEAYREHFRRHDDVVHGRLRDAIAAGRETGAFRDVRPRPRGVVPDDDDRRRDDGARHGRRGRRARGARGTSALRRGVPRRRGLTASRRWPIRGRRAVVEPERLNWPGGERRIVRGCAVSSYFGGRIEGRLPPPISLSHTR
ncbi:TetR/AcrR family transcriptional regulator [Halobacterium bonnevillei]|uniref:TetR/AcrR family transcriptional regulator n=1 Tax=Halobacterium bonnevillei TaxID=2692200 RepID=UPI001F1FD58B|nr:TetR family transcriptional regulator [Halobacterium bonnevillei]